MTLKLSELLFEEQNPKKLHRLFEDAEDSKTSDAGDNNNNEKNNNKDDSGGNSKEYKVADNVDHLSKAVLKKISH